MKQNSLVILILCSIMLLGSGAVNADSASLTVSGTIISPDTPVANFTANATIGYAPLSVQFTDLSTGTLTEWEWDFDADGNVDAFIADPVHTYPLPGSYSVSLTVRNSEGSDTELKPGYITVLESDPATRIESLKEYVRDLQLSSWAQWLLVRPLDRALDQLAKGHTRPAANQMRSFMNYVDLLHGFHMITDEQAAFMTSQAMAIIDLIG